MSHILIIDDDSRNVFALNAVLKAKKFPCLSARSAKEGITILKENKKIGLVLMDMMMPETDGYEAIEIIKADNQLKNIPVIAVTANAMSGDRERCIAAGADEYISKPVNVEQLLKLIKNLMNDAGSKGRS